jgi:hypothetical protein
MSSTLARVPARMDRGGMCADFESPRFQGDADLLEILNADHDGQHKLGRGMPNPPGAVLRVQQALWDLFWVKNTSPDALHVDFVIGTFGPRTASASLAYKTNYDIRFPPGDPHGSLDEFVGPTTLARLDGHCVVTDRATERILAKVADMTEAVELIVIAGDPDAPTTRPVVRTTGCTRQFFLPGEIGGHLYYRDGAGANELHGRLDTEYRSKGVGGPTGPLGFPIADVTDFGGDAWLGLFEGGNLTLDPGQAPVVQLNEGDPPGSFEDPLRRF